ncbi:hypothetical protein T484DRAFT_1988516, partial [Baffinella frigidus]
MVLPALLPRVLFDLYKLEGQACADPLALIPGLPPQHRRAHSWLRPTLGKNPASQQRFLADFPALIDDPADPNWHCTPWNYSAFVAFRAKDEAVTQALLKKCIETARHGKTVVLALGCTAGSNTLEKYTSSHKDANLFSCNFLQLPTNALHMGTPSGWVATPSSQISWDPKELCFTQPDLTHPDFPPRDTERLSKGVTKFLLFHPNPHQVQHALGHPQLLKLARALQGSLSPYPPHDPPKLLRPTRTQDHHEPTRYALSLSLSSLYQQTSTSPPLEDPMAPFLCAAWFLRKGTLPPGHTLQTYLPPSEHASFADATSLHELATQGIPDLLQFPAKKQRSFFFFPAGTLPTALSPFLVSRAGVSRTAITRVMTALAATSLWGYHEAELQKRLITSSLLQKQGIPPPMFDPRPLNITSPCECCGVPTPSLWLLRVSARDLPSQSKDSCTNTLHRASETYMKTHNVRLGRHRGPLMQSTHPYVRSRYLSQGAAVCWTCALPTFINRLHTVDRPLPPSSPPLPEDQGKHTLALYLRRYVLVEIRGPNARNAILNHLETAHIPAPYSPQFREKPGFQPLQPFLYKGERLIPYAVTPPHTPTINVRGSSPNLVVWCLPTPAISKKVTTPAGPYHEKDKFCSVPFADYFSATRPVR